MIRRLPIAVPIGLLGIAAGLILSDVVHDEPPPVQPLAAEVDAAVIVDAAVVEMHGYGPDGKPGEFLYDCEHADDPGLGDPTLICTQREQP